MVIMDKNPKPISAEPVGFKPPEVIHWDIMEVDGKEYIRLKRKDEKYEVYSTWNKIVRECSRSDLEEMFEVGMKVHADQLTAPGLPIVKLVMEYLCMLFKPEAVKHLIKHVFKAVRGWTLYERSGVYELALDTFHMEYYLGTVRLVDRLASLDVSAEGLLDLLKTEHNGQVHLHKDIFKALNVLSDQVSNLTAYDAIDDDLAKLKTQADSQPKSTRQFLIPLPLYTRKVDSLPNSSTYSMPREFEMDFRELLLGVIMNALTTKASKFDVLKLQPPPSIVVELGISKEKVELALLAQNQFEENQHLVEQLAKEEADKVEMSDSMRAQESELGKEEKTKEEEEIKKPRIEWYNEPIVGRFFPSPITNVRIVG
ncbi:hypothetical protein L6452_31072 [Arctium lappa]|uniref:Uncharacterized protein n=1 Tax=Arctium lappa TaxID=4217 RepID=A0ACB8ZKX0_ARCLA|nr:hypothetical protein L6452_31072 [Arctium lappa]